MVEEKDGKRPVQDLGVVDVLHQMTVLLGVVADNFVIVVNDKAHLFHKTDLKGKGA